MIKIECTWGSSSASMEQLNHLKISIITASGTEAVLSPSHTLSHTHPHTLTIRFCLFFLSIFRFCIVYLFFCFLKS